MRDAESTDAPRETPRPPPREPREIYIGMLVVDGERMAGLLTWPFVGILLVILAVRVLSHRLRRRRSRGPHAKS